MNRFNYKYLKTYSGLRGAKYSNFVNKVNNQIKRLQAKGKTVDLAEQQKINNEVNQLKRSMFESNILIVNNNGEVHSTTSEMSTLQHNEKYADYIFQFFEHFSLDEPFSTRCLPVYRDSIVFFDDNDNIIKMIHICFQCANIKDGNNKNYFISDEGYHYFKQLLKELGHQIN